MKSVGDRGELLVAYELLNCGWNVSFPFGDNSHYDIIAERDGRVRRIQVKCTEKLITTSPGGPRYLFNVSYGSSKKEKYNTTDVDFIVCCALSGKRFWVIPVASVKGKTLKIFLEGKTYEKYEKAWDLLR
jgi:hypothetical protein|tara:strand:- start:1510 stop:1899 length:390 start_codon:yes stop_codon:yes gene_type:complete